uniref:Fatty-acid and retinol-binding protein 1 n=1 Tax=Globodera rostochiensis TaxID=31243 RepID=A0A914HVN8_GLORO
MAFLPLALFIFTSVESVNSSKITTKFSQTNDDLLQLPSELGMARVREVVPVEASDFYDQLTGRDKQVLRKVLAKADSYTSTSELLEDLRNGSSTLYDRAVQVVTSLRSIIARLSPPARTYIDESAEQLRNALGNGFSLANLKAQVQQLVRRYRQLDLATKVELRETFPRWPLLWTTPCYKQWRPDCSTFRQMSELNSLVLEEEEAVGEGAGRKETMAEEREEDSTMIEMMLEVTMERLRMRSKGAEEDEEKG